MVVQRSNGRFASRWSACVIKTLWQDIKVAIRSLRRHPGFACVAASTIALAIGANTAVFTVVNGVLLRPLPFADADRLMVVSYWPTYTKGNLGAPAMLGRDYVTFQRENRSFERVALIIPHGARLTSTSEAATLPGAQVSADFFAVLGIKPAIGRTFAPDEGSSTGAGVVVISNTLWRERFAADSAVVGRTIVLDGQPQTIIGVMPAGFEFPKLPAQAPVRGITPFPASQYWMAIAVDPVAMNYPGPVIGRLRVGVTPQQARAELGTLAKTVFVAFRRQQGWCCALSRELEQSTTAQVLPLRDIYLSPPSLSPEESRDARKPLLLFAAAVAMVFAIACSNVAGLILMRTMSRTHDIAVRAALGASRWRLVQHALIESLCISAAGAIAGVPLAWVSVRVLLGLAPSGAIPLAEQVGVDGRVLALGAAMALISGVLAGVAPAILASRQAPQQTLGRTVRMSNRHPVLEATTAASIAFALILLTGAGLLIQSVLRLQGIRLGFDPSGVVVMRVIPSAEMSNSAVAIHAFRDRVRAELAQIPQTVAAAAGSRFLLGQSPGFVGAVSVEGRDKTKPDVVWSNITEDYFDVLRMPVVAGRAFTADDDDRAPRVAIVNQSFANTVWPGESALGKRVWMEFITWPPKDRIDPSDWVTVVGIVGDVVHGSIKKSPPMVYYPLDQLIGPGFTSLEFSVRTTGDPTATMRAMRRVMHDIARDLPIEVLTPLSRLVELERLQPLFQARLIAAFSLLAIVLAAIGTYSVLAFSVAQRSHELAIRMALGAQPAGVIGLVMRRGALFALIGIVVGLGGSFALTRALQSALYQTSATDPRVFAGATVLLVVVALLACIIPTRRATRLDPSTALREI
jgi:putative ABC transport system permease protein